MNNFLFFVSLVSLFLNTQSSFAQEKCLSGKTGNPQLLDQLKTAQQESPITKIISEKYNLNHKTQAEVDCKTCKNNTTAAEELQKIVKEKMYFKADCIAAAASIQTGSNEILCPSAKIANHQFCFSNSLLNYQNAVMSDFYKCVKSAVEMPITPAGLFQMYTLESGFKPAYTNKGGTGIGQLTSIFIKDLHQKHRGRTILESIANSNSSSCSAAKIIAQKDLIHEPNLSEKCQFTQYGEGVERNILYSLAGLASSWKKDIFPLMKDYLLQHREDPYLQAASEQALLNAYGSGGRAAARAAVRRLRVLPPQKFFEAYQKPLRTKKNNQLTAYTMKLNKSKSIIEQKLSGDLKSRFSKEGTPACTE